MPLKIFLTNFKCINPVGFYKRRSSCEGHIFCIQNILFVAFVVNLSFQEKVLHATVVNYLLHTIYVYLSAADVYLKGQDSEKTNLTERFPRPSVVKSLRNFLHISKIACLFDENGFGKITFFNTL